MLENSDIRKGFSFVAEPVMFSRGILPPQHCHKVDMVLDGEVTISLYSDWDNSRVNGYLNRVFEGMTRLVSGG